MVKTYIKEQLLIEEELNKLSTKPLDPQLTLLEALGGVEKWLHQVGEYRFFLNPFNGKWMYYDSVHKTWEKTGYLAGEGLFLLDEDGEMCFKDNPNQKKISPVSVEEKKAINDGGNKFLQYEEKYFALKGRLETGLIDHKSFLEELYRLRIQDESGIWWQIDDHGKWLKWDGREWSK